MYFVFPIPASRNFSVHQSVIAKPDLFIESVQSVLFYYLEEVNALFSSITLVLLPVFDLCTPTHHLHTHTFQMGQTDPGCSKLVTKHINVHFLNTHAHTSPPLYHVHRMLPLIR